MTLCPGLPKKTQAFICDSGIIIMNMMRLELAQGEEEKINDSVSKISHV